MSETTKAYVTKYALTRGIIEVEGRLENSGTMLVYRRAEASFNEYAHRNEFQLTRSDALDRVEAMIEAKCKSLRKQLARLESLTPENVAMHGAGE